LSILPDVEVQLIHMLTHPIWNGPYSFCTAACSQCAWLCLSLVMASYLSIKYFVTCGTSTEDWKPEVKIMSPSCPSKLW